jgi:hypothetical protein
MNGRQEVEQRLRVFIEARGGSVKAVESQGFDRSADRNNFEIAAPEWPKPAIAAVGLLLSFTSPMVAHEVLTSGTEIMHDWYHRNDGKSIKITAGRISITLEGSDDYQTALETFRRAKGL